MQIQQVHQPFHEAACESLLSQDVRLLLFLLMRIKWIIKLFGLGARIASIGKKNPCFYAPILPFSMTTYYHILPIPFIQSLSSGASGMSCVQADIEEE
jgi:hypothetical protein